VVEKPGTIRVIKDGALAATPFLDVTDFVEDTGERGLLSVAFPSNYGKGSGSTTRRFYVFFTNQQGHLRIKEYKRSSSSGNAAVDPTTYNRTVLGIPHLRHHHYGGQLRFGPDGFLYVSTGDGATGGGVNAQDKSSLLGKILRFNPLPSGSKSHTNPAGNPFAGPTPGAGEIFSMGLRNPFRFSFNGRTLAIGDVGEATFEEHNILSRSTAKGANFGWPGYEGPKQIGSAIPGHVPPDFWYCHSAGQDPLCPSTPTGNVTTGGYIVRDTSLGLTDRYMYADFTAGQIRTFNTSDPFDTDAAAGISAPSLSSFGKDNAKRLYVASLDGPVYRIVNN
jgi:glucose/arabinose dehydrogenase